MIRGYRVWDNQEKTYSDKAFSIDQFGICYVQDEDGYWEEANEDRFTIEFDTGLKDKNGKEIYEGDLIKVSDAPALKDKTLVVEFGEYDIDEYACTKMSGWLVQVVNSDWTASLLDEVDRCEVIGNIHENKGLLEKGE